MRAVRPLATYRLQFHAGFTFADATAIVDYLADLGISHAYASSYLRAVPGSTHGYDVADPTALNPEVGTEDDLRAWVAALRARDMGHLLDFVPNHMGIAKSANRWWQDVLENGQESRHARAFDIDWAPVKTELAGKVLLPILGQPYGDALESQAIVLSYEDGGFLARYYEQLLPIAPATWDRVLGVGLDAFVTAAGESDEDARELLSILTAIRRLPSPIRDDAALAEREREQAVVRRRLATLVDRSPSVRAHVIRAVGLLNGTPGDARSFDALDALLGAQAYRLAYWRVAAEEINYRRFFDINELAAIRMEDAAVFERTHALVFRLFEDGLVDGLRIDHVDGLFDPADYLTRLQDRLPDAYLVVEKILAHDEPLPDWPVAGTTGYDLLVRLNGLFIDQRNEDALTQVYERFTRLRVPYREIAYRGKEVILRLSMASELNVLAHQLNRLSEQNRHYRDFTLNSLASALREVIACFPVYRTYVTGREASISARDRQAIDTAVDDAQARNPRQPTILFAFVRDLLRTRAFLPADQEEARLRFIGRFQQLTSPVTAKGIEDTAFYVYNRLVSLNEVGGEPDRFGVPPDDLHAWFARRAEQWPGGLSATSTHDTKRSEDIRARLNVLSELPGAWKQATARWAALNRRGRSLLAGQSYPSRNEEYLLYQALVGSWPFARPTGQALADYTDRIEAYMRKAMREAKVYTNWLNPSEPHERAMARFLRAVLHPGNGAFLDDLEAFAGRVARYGIWNGLAQLVTKLTAPGVPDFYQGTELWDLSLVDPDNRRPVDYVRRRDLLQAIRGDDARLGREALLRELLSSPEDGRIKLFVTTALLHARRAHRATVAHGSYEAVSTEGTRREHLFAFVRRHERDALVVLVPRLPATLLPDASAVPVGERVWGDTNVRLPAWAAAAPLDHGPAAWRDILTGREVRSRQDGDTHVLRVSQVLAECPVAVLEAC